MVFTVTSSNCQVKIARFYEFFRLQNSSYFCVFKYARAVKQKVWNEVEKSEPYARGGGGGVLPYITYTARDYKGDREGIPHIHPIP